MISSKLGQKGGLSTPGIMARLPLGDKRRRPSYRFSTKEKGFCIIKTKTPGRELHAKVSAAGAGMTKFGKTNQPLPANMAEASRRFGRQMTPKEEGEPN
jgi:hypothetical protein